MDGFLRGIGDSISGLWRGAVDSIGGAVEGAFGELERAAPGGLLLVGGIVLATVVAWRLITR
jgi:hypothetical protein